MTKIDIEAIAREAELIEPSDVWADLPPIYTQALSRFAALVLEKAADHCDTHYNHEAKDCADELRTMSAALQSGDRG